MTVLDGQNITDADDKLQLLQQMCSGEALTAFNAGVQVCHMANWTLLRGRAVQAEPARDMAGGETNAEWQARCQAAHDGVAEPAFNDNDILAGKQALMVARCPYRVLETQKRFMRRKMHKPQGMLT